MSARGTVIIDSTDPAALRATPYVQEWLHDFDDGQGSIMLGDVNSLKFVDLVEQAPDVGWIAYMDSETEEPNQAIGRLPGGKVFFLDHVDQRVVVDALAVRDIDWEDFLRISPSLRAYFQLQDLIAESEKS